jgi:ubiquinone/menaquinone biosynthesis C-methylase UbiE
MRTDVHHPVFARVYEQLSRLMERELSDHRQRLLTGLSGSVVEVGAGNGLNFRHYPVDVDRVVAVEPEEHLRRLAGERARTASVDVEVIDGIAGNLPLADGSFDAAVVSLVLCSVGDQSEALAEIGRVLRPGGQLRFFEHVAAHTAGLARVQQVLDATIWPFLGGGCHTSRHTLEAIEAAGFEVIEVERMRVPDGRVPLPTSPHVLGVARLL